MTESSGLRPLVSTRRVLSLLTGLALRRAYNRAFVEPSSRAARERLRRRGHDPERTGAAAKGGGGCWGLVVIVLLVCILGPFGYLWCCHGLGSLALVAEAANPLPDEVWVEPWVKHRVARVDRELRPIADDATEERQAVVAALARDLVERAGGTVRAGGTWDLGEEDRRRIERILTLRAERGTIAIRTLQHSRYRFRPPPGRVMPEFWRALAIVYSMLLVAFTCVRLGIADEDLGRVGWSLEWFYSLPVRTSSLLWARLGQFTLGNVTAWFVTCVFTLALGIGLGLGSLVMVLAPLAAGMMCVLSAALRLALETWLRATFSLRTVKSLQAAFLMVGALSGFALLWLVVSRSLPGWVAPVLAATPESLGFWPTVASLWPLRWPGTGTVAASGVAIAGAAVSVGVSALLLRRGLVHSSVHRVSSRGRRTALGALGVVAKELLLLRRDRAFATLTLVIPVLIIGLQLANLAPVTSNAGPGSEIVIAYVMSAYVLVFAVPRSVLREYRSSWIAWTFPAAIEAFIMRKGRVWLGIALAYLTIGSAALGASLTDLPTFACAALSLSLLAQAILGAAVLGGLPAADPPRIAPAAIALWFLVAADCGWAIQASAAVKLALYTQAGLLVLAIRQDARERAPYLLDPVTQPPRELRLLHGLVASMAFIGFKNALTALVHKASKDPALAAQVGYLVAGSAALITCSIVFAARKTRFAERVRIRGSDIDWPRVFRIALRSAAIASAIGALYLLVVRDMPWFVETVADAPDLGLQEATVSTVLIVVVAAPLVEEFIYRGLVYTGLRRRFGPWASAFASAALFVSLHPAVSWVPVFALGVVTAVAFERGRSLLAPILVHAIYNSVVLAMQ